jgi:hypothetical protein
MTVDEEKLHAISIGNKLETVYFNILKSQNSITKFISCKLSQLYNTNSHKIVNLYIYIYIYDKWNECRTSLQSVPSELPSIENDAHGIEKLLLKTQISEKFLSSEVNLMDVVQLLFPSNFHTITSLQRKFFLLYYIKYYYIKHSQLIYIYWRLNLKIYFQHT